MIRYLEARHLADDVADRSSLDKLMQDTLVGHQKFKAGVDQIPLSRVVAVGIAWITCFVLGGVASAMAWTAPAGSVFLLSFAALKITVQFTRLNVLRRGRAEEGLKRLGIGGESEATTAVQPDAEPAAKPAVEPVAELAQPNRRTNTLLIEEGHGETTMPST